MLKALGGLVERPSWAVRETLQPLAACLAIEQRNGFICGRISGEDRLSCLATMERMTLLGTGHPTSWRFTTSEAEACRARWPAETCAAISAAVKANDRSLCPQGDGGLCRGLFSLEPNDCRDERTGEEAQQRCRAHVNSSRALAGGIAALSRGSDPKLAAFARAVLGQPDACSLLLGPAVAGCLASAADPRGNDGLRHPGDYPVDDSERESEPVTLRTLQQLRLERGLDVADVGAGSGFFTFRIAHRIAPGRVLATETSDLMLGRLARRVADTHANNVDLVPVNNHELGLPPGSVDRILIFNVYLADQLERPALDAWLEAAYAALRPGGRVVAYQDWARGRDADPSSARPAEPFDLFVDAARRRFDPVLVERPSQPSQKGHLVVLVRRD